MNDSGLRHRLMAILCADASGYSRRMAQDELSTVAELDAARQVFRERVAEHDGRIVDLAGDSVLAVFDTAAGAVDAAVAVQQQLASLGAGKSEVAHLRFRIGVHLGDVFEKPDGSIYGHGVNVAARLQTLALEGGISVSDSVRITLGDRVAHRFVDQGQHAVRNIGQPLHAFGFPIEGTQGAVASASGAAREAPHSPPTSTQALGNLPAQLPPLYGRAEDVSALAQLLALHRVVSVVGPAGIGKTRAAQAVAHTVRDNFVDGAWLVELAPLADEELVVPTVARVLGHPMAAKETALASLIQLVRDQRLLLVLDNCEHLLEGVAELAAQIVAGAPDVRLLVTSQEPLHIAQEQVCRLNALAVPPSADATAALGYGAVQLFVARAQAVDSSFAVDSKNANDVVEICRQLDGIALAIELAAARVPLLGVRGVHQRLDERLKLLAASRRTALPRHQALRGALQWSHGLLTAAEQTVFDRLGVFMGTFSLEAAQFVAGDDTWAVLDHLASLVDKSLVLAEGGETKRYRLLESSRAFALERLATACSLEAIRKRHAQAIANTLTDDDPFEEPLARTRRIAPDLGNVRAAAAWAMGPGGDRQIAVALAAATDRLWDAHGFNDEGARLYRAIEPWVDEATQPRLAARFWFAVADLRMWSDTKRQAEAGLKAAELFRKLGDRYWVFRSLAAAVYHFALLADRVAAERALTEMEALLDPAWPPWLQFAIAYCKALREYWIERRPEEARKVVVDALQSHRRGTSFFGDGCESLLPLYDLAAGDFASALHQCEDLLGGTEAIESTSFRAYLFAFRSLALVGLGSLEAAEASLRTATTMIAHAQGPATWVFCYIAHLLAHQGRFVEAARTIACIDNRLDHERLPPVPVRCYEEALAIIKTGLDTAALGRLRNEGSRLSAEEVIAMAFRART